MAYRLKEGGTFSSDTWELCVVDFDDDGCFLRALTDDKRDFVHSHTAIRIKYYVVLFLLGMSVGERSVVCSSTWTKISR